MSTNTIRVLMLFLLVCSCIQVMAQQGVVATGGDIHGAGGTMSFSVGLPDFYFYKSGAGSLQFGLQHAFFVEENDIPEEIFLEDVTVENGVEDCFAALLTITTAGNGTNFIVSSGGQSNLIAGLNIIMKDGTVVEPGGSLHARITTDGNFCPEAGKHFLAADVANEEEAVYTLMRNDIDASLTINTLFFSVFPNPTTGMFTLELNQASEKGKTYVEVYGVRGERFISEEIPAGLQQYVCNLEGQLPGIYIIRLLSGEQFGVTRIIKR